MAYEVSSGGIVLRNGSLVLVCDGRTGLTGFPKGHVEKGENLEKAARREIGEETGISELKYFGRLGSYIRRSGSGGIKNITLYKFRTLQEVLEPVNSEVTAKWVLIDSAVEEFGYEEDRKFFLNVLDRLRY